jgi:hypothetical protein
VLASTGAVAIHQRLGVAVLVLGAVGSVVALGGISRRRVSPTLRAYLRLTSLVIAVQAALGIALVIRGYRAHDNLHFIYGPAVLLALPVAQFLGGRSDERREAIALFAGALAVFLLAIRAIGTGGA